MVEVYIDGASAGNPGPSGAGIFIKGEGYVIKESIPLGTMTNHHAEFSALIEALKICAGHGFSIISLRTDSQIVADAVEKRYVKREEFQKYLNESLTLMDDHFDYCFIKWIPGKQNKEADFLSKRAVQMNK
ncbi:reverse transcriptase-like protein [Bacillus sp. H-16]|uniref:reverse transcriptase-like protein n=1 Tax=Alteribacter salitolerans TaxID=2912333 RepID=UPI00196271F8|nr:reverse transcriptase-like protein [Alteribacter salitolerans]MBM7094367.1 reverse transcriptase-like protein [Alteribacter salitolerans]